MARRADPKIIGLFGVGALALAVAAAVALGSGRLFRKTYQYVLFFRGNVNGLRVGAPVKFKGVEIGSVKKILLSLKLKQGTTATTLAEITIPVVIELDQGKLTSYGAGGFDLSKPESLQQAIDAGLRAQLAMESVLTGLLYVDLEIYPGSPANFVFKVPAEAPYQEIPTLPTAFEEVQSAVARLVAALDRVDFPKVFTAATESLDAVRGIVASPATKDAIVNLDTAAASLNQTAISIRRVADQMNRQIGPVTQGLRTNSENVDVTLRKIQTTLDSLQTTLGALQATLGPDAPLVYQSGEALERVSEAAESLKELTDYLQRNPSALVRGRAQ
jgi:paraquat-inducible protein B